LTSLSCYQRAIALYTAPHVPESSDATDEGKPKESTSSSTDDRNANIGAACLSIEVSQVMRKINLKKKTCYSKNDDNTFQN